MTTKRTKLTNTTIAALKATGRDYKVWDSICPGFHIRVTKGGSKSFALYYRTASGSQRSMVLGKAAVLKAEAARKLAQAELSKVYEGGDPSKDRRDQREAETMSDLWGMYYRLHALVNKKPVSAKTDERLWRLHLRGRFGLIKVADVDVAGVRRMMAAMYKKPGAANRTRALLSKMFSFAMDNGWRDDNPCARVMKFPENKLGRYLDAKEGHRLFAAADADPDQTAATIVKVLLLTGARRGEVLGMRWCDLRGLGTDNAEWVLPAGQQKGERAERREFVRHLDRGVAEILEQWGGVSASSEWVFPHAGDPSLPRACVKRSWSRIRSQAGLDDLRMHDLRHSFASFAVNGGCSLESIGKTLGHKSWETTMRYARIRDEATRQVSSAVGAVLGNAA